MKHEKSCGCIILDKREVLLVKHNSGHWDFPKGHVEKGETEIDTAIREVKEETGIDVSVDTKHRYSISYMPKSDVEKEVVYYIASKKEGEEIPQIEEVQKVEWVKWEDALNRITFNNSKELLKKAIHDKEEVWEIFDENKKKTGKTCVRDKDELKSGEYHIVVEGIIINSNGQILLTKRSLDKKRNPGLWETTRGSVIQGETSLDAMLREWKEEIGLVFDKNEPILFSSKIYRDRRYIKDIWIVKKDINIHAINFRDGEVVEAKWVDFEEYEEMQKNDLTIKTMDFDKTEYEQAKAKQQKESYSFLQKEVTIKIDRKLGTMHSCSDLIYPINYGYVPNVKTASGEEIRAYLLGVWEPVEEAKGKCTAVIHRINDEDDKLVIVPNGKEYSDDAIKALTEFKERFYDNEIIR